MNTIHKTSFGKRVNHRRTTRVCTKKATRPVQFVCVHILFKRIWLQKISIFKGYIMCRAPIKRGKSEEKWNHKPKSSTAGVKKKRNPSKEETHTDYNSAENKHTFSQLMVNEANTQTHTENRKKCQGKYGIYYVVKEQWGSISNRGRNNFSNKPIYSITTCAASVRKKKFLD